MPGPATESTAPSQQEGSRENESNRGARGAARGRGQGRRRRGGRGTSAQTVPECVQSSGRARGGQNCASSRRERGPRPQQNGTLSEVVSSRVFIGGLTRPNGNGSTQNDLCGEAALLRPDAPAFVPGASSATVSPTAPPPTKREKNIPKSKRAKSMAEDITTRIHEDILNGIYECPICTMGIGKWSKMWSCKCCWTVFHFGCIQKWSNNEGSAMGRPRSEEGPDSQARQWRCPGCNLPQDERPIVHLCWCEKEMEPRSLLGLPPNSCGQTCSKSRNGCPHPCDSVCHAGPCAPCQAMGPIQPCFCGRQESTKKCADTNYEKGWSCAEICGELLPCLCHTCPRPCHEGLCGACRDSVHAKCYCGKLSKEMLCRETEEEKESTQEVSGEVYTWKGTFNCKAICDRTYDCGIHRCTKPCHPQKRTVPHCPTSPDRVKYCQCGKSLLSELPNVKPRVSCDDPIPTCEKPCGKLMACKHPCPKVCHSGPCPPCLMTVDIKCRCGRVSSKSICHQDLDVPLQCLRVCKATMNCGRHTCGERCCPGERQSIERQSSKRKPKPFSLHPQRLLEEIEAEHICTRVCGRPLKCSKHQCQELCHKGICKTCPEAIFEEIPCHCGRTVLHPPLPCGTTAPTCHFDCERPKACGHPQTPHNCHMDNENCPKCPYLVVKKCLCGKITSKQPCSQPNGQCAFMCSKPSKCGAHTCQGFCHRPGECADSTRPCQKTCRKRLKSCAHYCQELCHAPYPCPESTPCSFNVTVTCPCGRIKEEKKCGSTHSKPKFHDDKLKCDDECARLQRNRDIAAALRVDIDPLTTTATGTQPRSHDTETFPYSDETLDLYIQSSSSSTLATLQGFEASLHSLAIQTSQKCTRFSPCRSQLRAFIHSLAADWGFQSESFDPEPVRHVLVSKTQGWISPGVATGSQPRIGIRGLSVAECIKLRDRECSKKKDTKKNAAENAGRKTQQEDDEWTVTETKDEFGWSRVVSKKKPEWWNDSDIQKTFSQPGNQQSGNGEGRSNWFSGGRFGSLVLKSGVGRGKEMATSRSSDGSKAPVFLAKGEKVVEDWEEEIKKEEDEQKENGKVTETTATPDLPDDLPWDHGFEGEGESHVVESGFWIAPGKY